MAINYLDSPKKKKYNRTVIDTALQRFMDEKTFAIVLEGNNYKTYDVTFRGIVTPLVMEGYYEVLKTNALRSEAGATTVEPALLELATHTFIIQNLSSMPLPQINEGADSLFDVPLIGMLGEYFRKVSPEYEELFSDLIKRGEEYCKTAAYNLERIVDMVLKDLDVSELLSNEAFTDVLGNLNLADTVGAND